MDCSMTNIVFPPIETENPARKIVEFDAHQDGKTIKCAITYQALYDYFDAEFSDPLFAFMIGRSKIEPLALQRIADNRFEKDGTILLKPSDF